MPRELPSVTFVTRKWPPSIGGMETYSIRLSEELAKLTEIQVIFLPGRVDGFVKTGFSLIWFGITASIKLLFRCRSDLVHFGDMSLWPLAVFAKIGNPQTRLYISAHGTDVTYPRRKGIKANLYGVYLKLGARFFGNITVIANSNATSDVVSEYGYAQTEIVTLGADTPDDQSAVIQLPRDDIFFAGRIIKLKGLSWFVTNVLSQLPGDIKLRVAGTAWDKQEAKVLDDPRVTYLGHLSQSQLQKEFQHSRCVVLPNIQTQENNFEGFGLTALEAAAAGGVVIASNHGGIKDAVKNQETGFLVEPGDHKAWAEKVTEIFNWSPTQRSQFISGSKKIVSQQYSWQTVAKNTLDVYLKS